MVSSWTQAAENPFPHEGRNSPNANWEWNLEVCLQFRIFGIRL